MGRSKIRMTRFHLFSLPHWLTHKEIRLPEAGETFNDNTLEEFYERVTWLIGIGYKSPDYLLCIIKKEIEEQSNKRGKSDEKILVGDCS